ncbi:MAG: type II toxin-antitoxin system Phd/YefM family antitoxin [Spirochaetia bacterium]|nr:type II toxin-antitoxin system Phd/YefM family antitoxin [Spirochaetia bacterium]
MSKLVFVSKGKFKAQALAYFRQVQNSRKAIVITDNGKPVLKMIPFDEDPESELALLRNSVLEFKDPLGAVGVEDWEALQ